MEAIDVTDDEYEEENYLSNDESDHENTEKESHDQENQPPTEQDDNESVSQSIHSDKDKDFETLFQDAQLAKGLQLMKENKEIMEPLFNIMQEMTVKSITKELVKRHVDPSRLTPDQVSSLLQYLDEQAIPDNESKRALRRLISSGTKLPLDYWIGRIDQLVEANSHYVSKAFADLEITINELTSSTSAYGHQLSEITSALKDRDVILQKVLDRINESADFLVTTTKEAKEESRKKALENVVAITSATIPKTIVVKPSAALSSSASSTASVSKIIVDDPKSIKLADVTNEQLKIFLNLVCSSTSAEEREDHYVLLGLSSKVRKRLHADWVSNKEQMCKIM